MRIKTDKADALFSKMIRERDNWTCVFCGTVYEPPTSGLQCSHFWGRSNKKTRFDPLNCDALCYGCHVRHEGNKQGYYRDFKLEQLGTKEYKSLEKRARSIASFGEKEKKACYKVLQSQYANREHLRPNWSGWIPDSK